MRRRQQDVVAHCQKYPESYSSLPGITSEHMHSVLNDEFRKMDLRINMEDFEFCMERGGHISGSAAIYFQFPESKAPKDIDIFFDDEDAFNVCVIRTWGNPHIDICWFNEFPYEGHDISLSMCSVDSNGNFRSSEEFQKTLSSGTANIIFDNLCYPQSTWKRALKYRKRYGVGFDQSEVVFLAGLAEEIDMKEVEELLRPPLPLFEKIFGMRTKYDT